MRIELRLADITRETVDAIVNAANSELAHGGGVALAIAEAAGPELVAESKQAPLVPTGEAVATTAGALPCKHVVHAVGPIWHGGEDHERERLASAYTRALAVADDLGCESIALPSISTGVYGFPVELAAPIALQSVSEALTAAKTLDLARFCLFADNDLAAYTLAAADLGIAV